MRFIAGIAFFLLTAFLLSSHRRRIHWPTIAWGIGLQWILAVVVLKGPWLADLLGFVPFPPGAFWGVALLFVLPTVLARLFKVRVRMLNRVLLCLGCLGLLRGNLVGAGFERLRLVVDGLMQYAATGFRSCQ